MQGREKVATGKLQAAIQTLGPMDQIQETLCTFSQIFSARPVL